MLRHFPGADRKGNEEVETNLSEENEFDEVYSEVSLSGEDSLRWKKAGGL